MEEKSRDLASKESLRQSEEMFRQLAENIREVLFLITPDYGKTYISPAYERVFGRSRDDLFVRPDAWVDSVHPEDRDFVRDVFLEGMQGRSTTMEYRLVRPDGTIAWIYWRSFPVQDSQGKLCRVVGIAEDITERRKVLEEAQTVRTVTEAGSRPKSEVRAKIRHEVLTLMNGIIGMTDLLQDTQLTEEQAEYLQMLKTSADSLLTTINQLLV
jgi:PAS domain S-box-containing protein